VGRVGLETWRRTLAFAMVSHAGVLLLGVGCLAAGGLGGAAVYAIGDGTVKAAMFVVLTCIAGAGAGRPAARRSDRAVEVRPDGARLAAGPWRAGARRSAPFQRLAWARS
jgi:multicomponent Na+:H+ antiporter subunit D